MRDRMSVILELTGWSEADIESVTRVPWSDHVEVRRWSGRTQVLSQYEIARALCQVKLRGRTANVIFIDDPIIPPRKGNPAQSAAILAWARLDPAHELTGR